MKRFMPVLLFVLCVVAPAGGAVRWGARAGLTDGEPMIGGDLILAIGRGFYFNPGLEASQESLTVNADVHYDIEIHRDAAFWVGGGLAQVLRDREDLDFGANLIAGLGVRRGAYIFYTQAKRTQAAGGTNFNTVAFGVRF
jgi:hypothetical protein